MSTRGLAREITSSLGIDASETSPDRISYARDLWPRHHIAVRAGQIADHRPRAIAWPKSDEDVAALVALCHREGVRIVPFGAGSGVCGGILPDDRTLVVDVKHLADHHIVAEEGFVDVGAGALGIRLEEDLQREGVTIGHFPSSILCSTAGGWIAARGAGQCSGRYGKIEDMVVSIDVVDGRGDACRLHRRAYGPDLTPLIIGSEGVLGVITRARFRIHPLARQRAYGAFSFSSMRAGWEAIRRIYQAGLRPAVCRLYDPFDSMMARRKKQKGKRKPADKGAISGALERVLLSGVLRLPGPLNAAIDAAGTRAFGGAMLVLLFEGGEEAHEGLERARGLVGDAESLGEGPARQWLDRRYAVSYRQAPMFMRGAFVDTMEVAAPWSRLEALYEDVRRALGRHVMVMAHMSHAYPDGCSIYFTFAGTGDRDRAEASYDAAWSDAAAAAIAAGGTLSHHHGVGRSKAPMLGEELGQGIAVNAALKAAFDPGRILNPGNLEPDGPLEPGAPPAPGPRAPVVDPIDETVRVAGGHTLGDVAAALAAHGLALELHADAATTVADFIATGCRGAPDRYLDPVSQLVTGYVVALPNGHGLSVRPCPRRAVGPDLWGLFHGTEGRAGTIVEATLAARRPAHPLETPVARQPPLADQEQAWVERCIEAVRTL